MLGLLMADGLEITNEPSEADALIVNTCSFIDFAQEESVDTILESAEFREAQRPDLKGADVRSWEHGLSRENNRQSAKLKGGQYTLARSEADAPDIDGRVYVKGELPLGDFSWVRVMGHTDYDLIAERM